MSYHQEPGLSRETVPLRLHIMLSEKQHLSCNRKNFPSLGESKVETHTKNEKKDPGLCNMYIT